MKYLKSRLGVVAVLVVAVAVPSAAGFAIYKHNKKPAATNNGSSQTTNSNLPSAAALKVATVDETDFTYLKPEDWAKLSSERLSSAGATSGIGHPLSPVATFIIRTTSALPANDNDMKNSTLDQLKKLSGFSLVSSTSTKVGGKTAVKFIYSFTDSDKTKVKQEMDVVAYKKTYFLLFASAESDFDKSSPDFGKILNSFTFKN